MFRHAHAQFKCTNANAIPCYTNKKIMLRCIVIGACAVQFLHYVPLYRNTQYYATLNCSIKTRLCGKKINMCSIIHIQLFKCHFSNIKHNEI